MKPSSKSSERRLQICSWKSGKKSKFPPKSSRNDFIGSIKCIVGRLTIVCQPSSHHIQVWQPRNRAPNNRLWIWPSHFLISFECVRFDSFRFHCKLNHAYIDCLFHQKAAICFFCKEIREVFENLGFQKSWLLAQNLSSVTFRWRQSMTNMAYVRVGRLNFRKKKQFCLKIFLFYKEVDSNWKFWEWFTKWSWKKICKYSFSIILRFYQPWHEFIPYVMI